MKKNRKIRGEITSRKIPTFGAAGEKPVESKEATSEESKEEASSKFAATFGAGGEQLKGEGPSTAFGKLIAFGARSRAGAGRIVTANLADVSV